MGDHVKHLCDTAPRVSAPGRPVGDRIYSNFTSVSGAAALCPVISLGARCGQAMISTNYIITCAPRATFISAAGWWRVARGHLATGRWSGGDTGGTEVGTLLCSQQIIVDSAAALLTQLETVGPTPSTALLCC